MPGGLAARLVRRIHGEARSADGFLLLREHFLDPVQERLLGRCYLGLAGAPIFILIIEYIIWAHGSGGRANFYKISEMPLDVKLLLPVMTAAFFVTFVSFMRLVILMFELKEQPRSLLGE
jgi:hypothetical protein